jgi:hypothetical protein
MEVGDTVIITNIGREDFIDQDPTLEEYIGCTGIIIDSDDTELGIIHHVHLDIFVNLEGIEEDDTYSFLESELEHSWEGGWYPGMNEIDAVEINTAFVMDQNYLSNEEKLAFVVICTEQPCDLDILCKDVDVSFKEMGNIIDKLLDLGFIVESMTSKNMFYPSYTLNVDKQKKKEKEKEKTVITDADGDLLLLMKSLEEYYKIRGVSYKISKNGKKVLTKTVTYLNKVWEKDREGPGDEFQTKGDLYKSYIAFIFQTLEDSALNHLKRLLHTGSRSAWRKSIEMGLETTSGRMFIPYFYDYQWSTTQYYGINKNEIPTDPKSSMYWTTVEIFLLNRWRTKTYPVCRQVLYALETVIIYHLFRRGKENAQDLMGKHRIYIKEYKQAETRDVLDDLSEYIKQNKKTSDICHNCLKKNTCLKVNENTHIVTCQVRQEA